MNKPERFKSSVPVMVHTFTAGKGSPGQGCNCRGRTVQGSLKCPYTHQIGWLSESKKVKSLYTPRAPMPGQPTHACCAPRLIDWLHISCPSPTHVWSIRAITIPTNRIGTPESYTVLRPVRVCTKRNLRRQGLPHTYQSPSGGSLNQKSKIPKSNFPRCSCPD